MNNIDDLSKEIQRIEADEKYTDMDRIFSEAFICNIQNSVTNPAVSCFAAFKIISHKEGSLIQKIAFEIFQPAIMKAKDDYLKALKNKIVSEIQNQDEKPSSESEHDEGKTE